MSWDQVHVFFDVASAIGTIVFFIIGLIIKNSLGGLEKRLFMELNRLDRHAVEHDGVCDTERKDFNRRLDRLESRDNNRWQS